jgi:hypothetical protein
MGKNLICALLLSAATSSYINATSYAPTAAVRAPAHNLILFGSYEGVNFNVDIIPGDRTKERDQILGLAEQLSAYTPKGWEMANAIKTKVNKLALCFDSNSLQYVTLTHLGGLIGDLLRPVKVTLLENRVAELVNALKATANFFRTPDDKGVLPSDDEYRKSFFDLYDRGEVLRSYLPAIAASLKNTIKSSRSH